MFSIPTSRSLLRLLALAALTSILLGGPDAARAHALGEDYIFVDVQSNAIDGYFEIHFNDLRDYVGLSLDHDNPLESIEATSDTIRSYIRDRFWIRHSVTDLPIQFTTNNVGQYAKGPSLMAHFTVPIDPVPDKLEVEHRLFHDQSKLHRGLFLINYNAKTGKSYGEEHTALVFSPGNEVQELDLYNVPSLLKPWEFIWQGILHIWIGIDHVLFLVGLILPAVLVRRETGWQPVERFRSAFWNIVKIVTLFTIAHSITLSLTALDLITLSSRLVESLIALSIVVVAVNNIRPFMKKTGALILVFGLFHGMGFASVMGHLPFRVVDLTKVVLAFNVGVEMGQVVIVAIAFPLLFALRAQRVYVPFVLQGGSVVVGLLASYWFIERALGL